ncbi:hypothetical protein F5B22DRAFT_649435 [Xylaria bambusicola]|uniref:uncharacterized protein n=1 Tax=Xylaria bambusicola TaxID=326684 RepID=UPI00200867A9|nr:uncharacterized protein F5B22DRAFT_649435 [Xylaria bambusicola]KAI0508933.1 hypothetical protein F5B22DRAFT_649435 [Xylaria bambusicola]
MGNQNDSKQAGSQHGSKPDIATSKASGSATIPPEPRLSFLFVVNEVILHPNAPPNIDTQGFVLPPFDPNAYIGEMSGTVFRYRDDEISVARGYAWARDNVDPDSPLKPSGSIYQRNRDEPHYEMAKYSQFTVFNGWGPLPCLYMQEDPLSTLIVPYGFHNPNPHIEGHLLHVMSFSQPDVTGITQISKLGSSRVVAGCEPSWIPSLVPEVFRNTDPRAPLSRGLGGLLPVIIAQMALTQPRGQTDRPFASRLWHGKRWMGGDLGSTVSHPFEVRAVVVHVALDEVENRDGSTKDALRDFEAGVIIDENRHGRPSQ